MDMANLQQVGIPQLEELKALYSQDSSKYCKEYYCLDNFLDLHRKDSHLKNVKVYCLPNLDLGLFVILVGVYYPCIGVLFSKLYFV